MLKAHCSTSLLRTKTNQTGSQLPQDRARVSLTVEKQGVWSLTCRTQTSRRMFFFLRFSSILATVQHKRFTWETVNCYWDLWAFPCGMKSRFSVLGSQSKLQEAQEWHDIWENREYPQKAYTVQLKFHGSSSSPANVVFGSCLSTADCRFRQIQVWHRQHFGYCPSRLSRNSHNLVLKKAINECPDVLWIVFLCCSGVTFAHVFATFATPLLQLCTSRLGNRVVTGINCEICQAWWVDRQLFSSSILTDTEK